jgi:hypothetical protein
MQGLPASAVIESLPWSSFPHDYTAMVTHMACIEHYKRSLLAYTMERLERLKCLYWNKRRIPSEVRKNLSPYEVDFFSIYEQNLKNFARSLDLDVDLTMDAAPPKSKRVQVVLHPLSVVFVNDSHSSFAASSVLGGLARGQNVRLALCNV